MNLNIKVIIAIIVLTVPIKAKITEDIAEWVDIKTHHVIKITDESEEIAQKILGSDPRFTTYKATSDKLEEELKQTMDFIEMTVKSMATTEPERLTIQEQELTTALQKATIINQELAKQELQLVEESAPTVSPSIHKILQQEVNNNQQKRKEELSYIQRIIALAQDIIDFFKSYSIKNLQAALNSRNPWRSTVAYIKKNNDLSTQEYAFRQNRLPSVRASLEQFLGTSLADLATDQLPVIAFSGSGGGYRAMILTQGYMEGLEKLGLLDSLMYVAGLSGSSWFFAPWLLSGLTPTEFKEILLHRIAQKRFNLTAFQYALGSGIVDFIEEIIWPKFVFDQPIRSIDLFGALLARVLFAEQGPERQKQYLSALFEYIVTGRLPFPLFAAISMHRENSSYEYNWYEFNPIEVRNVAKNLVLPVQAFGRKFLQGKSVTFDPEQNLGFLLAVFGSAYTINLKDLDKIFAKTLQEEANRAKGAFEQFKYKLLAKLFEALNGLGHIATARFSPAQVFNPFAQLSAEFELQQWLQQRYYLTFIDAGIDFNIPLPLVLFEPRNIDLIIIGDASHEKVRGEEIDKAFTYAATKLGYHYSRIDDNSTPTFKAYKEINNRAPVIAYITFEKDQDLIDRASGNPELKNLIDTAQLNQFNGCVTTYCSTFNFDYTQQQLKQLSGIATFNILANKAKLQQLIKDIICEKQKQ